MNSTRKKEIVSLLETINKATKLINRMDDYADVIEDCTDAYNMIIDELKDHNKLSHKVESQREKYKEFRSQGIRNNISFIEECMEKNTEIKCEIIKEVKCTIKMVFMPYKVSMWDSFASIYESAVLDNECEVKVVPIPYYKYDSENELLQYEGDRFPDNIEIIDYNEYSLDAEKPDVIFVHNIYDDHNKMTRVKEDYYTWNLKKYTDKLVYVPYCISSAYEVSHIMKRTEYSSGSLKYVDEVVLAGKFLEEEAVKSGVPKEKILTLGSPKFDDIYKRLRKNVEIPAEWKEVINNKKVILLNTGCTSFSDYKIDLFTKLNLIFDIPRYLDNIVVIWRPHPLTREGIKKFIPGYLSIYDDLCDKIRNKNPLYKNIILDEIDDYEVSMNISDMLITVSNSSVLTSYLMSNKPIITFEDYYDNKWILPDDLLYHIYDNENPWFEVVKKLSEGENLDNDKDSKLLSEIYENTDGTCGRKILEQVKNEIINS